MQNQDHMEVAETIRQQIMASGIVIPASWGMRQLIAMNRMERFGINMRGGLKFRVSGRLHKGFVVVWLTGSDDYTVELAKMVNGTFKTVSRLHGVYFDNLVDVIDGRVETA